MPSFMCFTQSGGHGIVSGDIYSGSILDVKPWGRGTCGGIQFRLAKGAPSLIYIGMPSLSGTTPTGASGGVFSSGGLADGMEVSPGDSYFVPRSRLVSGLDTVRVIAPAAASGSRCFWEVV